METFHNSDFVGVLLEFAEDDVFFSHGKSTTWGIYREYCLFFGGSLRKSMIIMFGICLVFLRQVWET